MSRLVWYVHSVVFAYFTEGTLQQMHLMCIFLSDGLRSMLVLRLPKF